MRRVLALFFALAMCVGLAGLAQASAIDTSKEVGLKMYLLGDRPADFDKVYDEINKELKDRINATVEVDFLSWAEHGTKYSLLFAAGEEFDLIFTAAGWAHYEEVAAKKGFLELTGELLSTYAPGVLEVLPDYAWEQAKISGKVYMTPNYTIEYGFDVVGIRGDLAEKYGMADMSTLEDLEAYFDKVLENEEGITPLAAQGAALTYLYQFVRNGFALTGAAQPYFVYDYTNPSSGEIISFIESPQFRQWAHEAKAMQEKGYWSKDSLSTTDTRTDAFSQGRAAGMVWNIGSVVNAANQMNADHPDWNATFVDPFNDNPKYVNTFTNNGMAVNGISRNPERALMAINEFMTNKKIWDLACYGIDGLHVQYIGEDEYVPLADAALYPVSGACNWGWNNENYKRQLHLDAPNVLIEKERATTAHWDEIRQDAPALLSFTFDDTNVKSEIAVLTTLVTQYYDPIAQGQVEDVDVAVDEFIQKLKAAGVDKVLAEMQNQADAYMAAKSE
jgi:putative aldouronate transport system substrate-binding protein